MESLEEYSRKAVAKLNSGLCPCCENVKLIRGKTWKERLTNWINRNKFCPNCGHTVAGT